MSLPVTTDMSVAMLVPSFPPLETGGSEVQCLKLSRILVRQGLRVLVVTRGKRGLKGNDNVEGVPTLRLFSVLNYLWALPAVLNRRRLRKQQRELVVCPSGFSPPEKADFFLLGAAVIFFMNALVALWRRRTHFQIIHVHTIEWAAVAGILIGKILKKNVLIKDSTRNGIGRLLRYPFGRHLQKLVVRNGLFVAISKSIEDDLVTAGVPRDRIFRIPNGVVIPELPASRTMSGQTCLFVGNLYQQPAKGVDVLLRAWPRVLRRCPSARLHVVGDGNVEKYQDYARTLGITSGICFFGKVTNVQEHLLAADVFVLPSRREGMSNALIEAMACGLPCAATDISGNQDLIENEVNGLLVPVEDVDRLADAIIFLLEHPDAARAMGTRARKTVEEKCDMGVIARRYVEVYQKIISGR